MANRKSKATAFLDAGQMKYTTNGYRSAYTVKVSAMADFAESEVRAERARIAAELRALVVRSHSWDAYADAMEKFIEELEAENG